MPSNSTQKSEKRGTLANIKFLLIGAAIGFIAGIFVYITKWNGKPALEAIITTISNTVSGENYMLTIGNVEEVLKPASDLISTKYYYTDADTYENYKELFGKRVPFTTDKVVFIYDGIISVGVDLSEVQYDINNDSKMIVITLPEIKILSNEIDADSFEFPYMSDSIFNSTRMDDYTKLIGKLKAEKAEELMNNQAFINEAVRNTQTVLKQFLTVSEATKRYTVIFN